DDSKPNTERNQTRMEHEDSKPLKWPQGWARTRLQDRKASNAWKKTYNESVDALLKELGRLKATACLITRNEKDSADAGVAVYFSLKPIDNYGWQEALGLIGEVPTLKEIDRAYMDRIAKIHPDGPNPDLAMFHKLTEHRDRARAWARGEQLVEHDKVIAV